MNIFYYERLLKKLTKEIIVWDKMKSNGDPTPAFEFFTLSSTELNDLSAKGLIKFTYAPWFEFEYNRSHSLYNEDDDRLVSVQLTDKGQTFIIDKKSERINLFLKSFLVPIITSIITASITYNFFK